MLSPRVYAEFAALQTASAVLVLTPYTDDLVGFSVANARVIRITRPGGLSLTLAPDAGHRHKPPSALAQNAGDGPSYHGLSPIGAQMTGGSFLATERGLNQAVARLKNANANHAPGWSLARFYLTNHFAAEALGLLNLIQAKRPRRLRATPSNCHVMRAAADYMMGRYRDAHNDLAGAQFRFRCRHAAFWRGLDGSGAGELAKRAHLSRIGAGRNGAAALSRRMASARAHLSDAEACAGHWAGWSWQMPRWAIAAAAGFRTIRRAGGRAGPGAHTIRRRRIATTRRRPACSRRWKMAAIEQLAAQAIFYQAGCRASTPAP